MIGQWKSTYWRDNLCCFLSEAAEEAEEEAPTEEAPAEEAPAEAQVEAPAEEAPEEEAPAIEGDTPTVNGNNSGKKQKRDNMFFYVSLSSNVKVIVKSITVWKLFETSSKWDHDGCHSFIRLEMT